MEIDFDNNPDDVDAEKMTQYTNLVEERDAIADDIENVGSMIAALTGVDGAVLITERFRVMGFGCEITATSPTLRTVVVEARTGRTPVSIDAYGTRHRSAFRFCASLDSAVAFVVSQDGGIKAAKLVNGSVCVWPDFDAAKAPTTLG